MGVDSDHPQKIREETKNFPLRPINEEANIIGFTEYRNSIKPKNCRPYDKLIWNEQRSSIHNRHLQFLVRFGMKVEEVLEVISFKVKQWLVPYFHLNTTKGAPTSDPFEEDFCKLLSNEIYEKTMENVRNKIRIELISDKEVLRLLYWQNQKLFDNIQTYQSTWVIYKKNVCFVFF